MELEQTQKLNPLPADLDEMEPTPSPPPTGVEPLDFPIYPSPNYEPWIDTFRRFNLDFDTTQLRNGITVTAAANAAWALLLAHHSASGDVCFDTAGAGREIPLTGPELPLDGAEDRCGPTQAAVPLSCHVDPSMPVFKFLRRIQSGILKIMDGRDFNPPDVNGQLGVTRPVGKQRTFFAVRPVAGGESQHLPVTEPERGISDADRLRMHALMVLFTPTARGAQIDLGFDSNVLPNQDAQRVTDHFRHIFHRILSTNILTELADITEFSPQAVPESNGADQDLPHSGSRFDLSQSEPIAHRRLQSNRAKHDQLMDSRKQQPLPEIDTGDPISPDDIKQITAWNSSPLKVERRSPSELFDESVKKWPSSVAIESWDCTLTYLELHRLSLRLAIELLEIGVGPGCFVALCIERSAHMTIAVLAALRTGATFVPIDTASPDARKGVLIAECHATALVCSTSQSSIFEGLCANLIVLDGKPNEMRAIEPTSNTAQLPSILMEQAAYCYFTSGSTGRPKGALISYSTLSTSLLAQGQAFAISESTRIAQFAAHMWDASLWEMLVPLIHGGTVCIPREEQRRNSLPGYIEEAKVNYCILTPTVARSIEAHTVHSLQTLVLVGEAIGQQDMTRWLGKVELLLAYGSVECGMLNSSYQVTRNGPRPKCLGKPFESHCWIVDRRDPNKLLPIGSIGELLVSGPLVGKGYLGNDEQTAAAFLSPLEWSAALTEDTRFYRTGDLVRYGGDGQLYFVSRDDRQVKIRGQRLEIGEIEQLLLAHPEVFQAVVEFPRTGPFMDRLVAILEFRGIAGAGDQAIGRTPLDLAFSPNAQSCIQDVETYISENGPAHGVPRVWIAVRKVPLTTTGKIDRALIRQYLAQMDKASADSIAEVTKAPNSDPPATTHEERLAEMWSGVLEVPLDAIGRQSNFYNLGGDSMRGMALAWAARDRKFLLSVRDISEHPTLDTMAVHLYPSDAVEDQLQPFSMLPGDQKTEHLVAEAAEACGIEVDMVEDLYPAVPFQEGLMALTEGRHGIYTAQSMIEYPSDTDMSCMKDAWEVVISSNTILRTRLVTSPNLDTLQVVVRDDFHWKTIESGHDEKLQEAAADAKATITFGRPLISLIACGNQLCVTAHHAIYDGWSLPLVLGDVRQVYATGTLKSRPPFRDFVQYALGHIDRKSSQFWKQQLAGCSAPAFPPLPHASYKPNATTMMMRKISLPRPRWPQVSRATLFTCALALTLAAFSGSRDDVVMGAVFSGRGAPVRGISDFLGPTVTTLPLRVCPDMDLPAQQLLQRMQSDAAERAPHEHLGLQRIMHLGDDQRRACKFQTLLVIYPATGDKDHGSAQIMQQMADDPDSYRMYPLTTLAAVGDADTHVRACYDGAVIGESRVGDLLDYLHRLCAQLSDATDSVTVSQVMAAAAKDQHAGLLMRRPGPVVNKCVHNLIRQACAENSQRTAVDAWDGRLSFADVDRLSSRLAHHLVKQEAVQPEVVVGYCMEKSKYAVVAVLGIIKAGGICLPLDPNSSASHRAVIMQTAGAEIVIASPAQALQLTGVCKSLITLDGSMLDSLPDTSGPACTSVTSDNGVYLIFTSGTTGDRKGALWEHKTLCSSIMSHGPALGFARESRVSNFSAHIWDMCIMEMLTTLTFGGTVCVPSDDERLDAFEEFVLSKGVNLAFLTPSFAKTLDPERLGPLRTVLLGGEFTGDDMIATWSPHVDQLFNTYGPCEVCITATTCSMKETQRGNIVGLPLPSSVCWVVDAHDLNCLVPVGAVGEILVEGTQLARGYINDPQRTQGAFLGGLAWADEKTTTGAHRRFYRTGDQGQMSRDGSLTLVGRLDDQIKINGQRVTLGEVEHCLNQLPEVNLALAVYPDTGDFCRQLVAIVTLAEWKPSVGPPTPLRLCTQDRGEESDTKIAKIEEAIQELLPAYAIPLCIAVETLPLTASRKLDRQRVKAWLIDSISSARAAISQPTSYAPVMVLTDTEQRLRQLWADILQIPLDHIRPDSSWMRLGGDSITGIHFVAAARKQGMLISVRDMLGAKTLTAVARKVKAPKDVTHLRSMSVLADRSGEPFPLSPIQRFHLRRPCAATERFNQSWLLETRRYLSPKALQDAITAICTRHGMLKAVCADSEERSWQQRIDQNANVPVIIRKVDSISAAMPVVEEMEATIDLRHGPVFVVCLFQYPNGRQAVFFVAHHLVVDVVSWQIIFSDLEEYLASGRISGPESLPFHEWSRLQEDHIHTTLTSSPRKGSLTVEADLQYWAMDSNANLEQDTVYDRFKLDRDATEAILGYANAEFRTQPLDIQLAGLAWSFQQAFPDRKLPAISLEGHGREPWDSSLDTTRTVGWFTILWPLVVDLQGCKTAKDALRRAKDARRTLSDNGFEDFAASQLRDDGNYNAPVELILNYSSVLDGTERTPGFLGRRIEPPSAIHDRSPQFPRLSLLQVESYVSGNELHFDFIYNRHMAHQDKIGQWVENCRLTLQQFADGLSARPMAFTLTDFPMMPASYEELDHLSNTILPGSGFDGVDGIENMYPSTPMQDEILLAQQTSPSAYYIQSIVKLAPRTPTDRADLATLARAWQRVVDRHDILRTVFVECFRSAGRFQQVVLSWHQAQVGMLNPQASDEACLETLVSGWTRYWTGLEPEHHLSMCQTIDGTIFCKLDINHALVDAPSLSLFWSDLCAAYDQRLPGTKAPSYCLLVEYLRQEDHVDALGFWQNYLADYEPCNFPTLEGQQSSPHTKSVGVAIGMPDELRNVCRSNGVTPANLMQAAWALVLRAYTGNDSVCFGYLSSGREVAVEEVDEIAGPFITMMISRIDLASHKTVHDVALAIQSDYVEGLQYRGCSIPEAFRSLGISPDHAFNTGMSYRRAWPQDITPESTLTVQPIGGKDPSQYDFVFNVEESDDGFQAYLTYRCAVSSDMQAQRIAAMYTQVIQSCLERFDQPPDAIQSFNAADIAQLECWNSKLPSAVNDTVHHMIYQMALQQPHRPAISSWDLETDLSYSQVEEYATQLALDLARRGIGPESFVPFCFPKSTVAVIVILAILKAGGACAPLDPSHPADYSRGIVQNVGARLVLISTSKHDIFRGCEARTLAIDMDYIKNLRPLQPPHLPHVTPDNAAYIIHTSGTTGKPKAVVYDHCCLSTGITYHAPALKLGSTTRTLQFAAYVFDVSVMEILTTWVVGGCVCIPPVRGCGVVW